MGCMARAAGLYCDSTAPGLCKKNVFIAIIIVYEFCPLFGSLIYTNISMWGAESANDYDNDE